jgi:hypothetical protein
MVRNIGERRTRSCRIKWAINTGGAALHLAMFCTSTVV